MDRRPSEQLRSRKPSHPSPNWLAGSWPSEKLRALQLAQSEKLLYNHLRNRMLEALGPDSAAVAYVSSGLAVILIKT